MFDSPAQMFGGSQKCLTVRTKNVCQSGKNVWGLPPNIFLAVPSPHPRSEQVFTPPRGREARGGEGLTGLAAHTFRFQKKGRLFYEINFFLRGEDKAISTKTERKGTKKKSPSCTRITKNFEKCFYSPAVFKLNITAGGAKNKHFNGLFLSGGLENAQIHTFSRRSRK